MSSPHTGSTWPAPVRRIVTSHLPSSTPGSSVNQTTDLVPLRPVLSGAAVVPLHSSLGCPTTSTPYLSSEDITAAMDRVPGVLMPNGVNCQMTDLKPGFQVPMHRTNSVDYNIVTGGSVWHITPTGKKGADGTDEEERVLVRVGEVVVQRGTLHAWEAGPEGARWVCVVIAALPVEIDGKSLEEVAFA
ncbi:uncharacterized protein MKK02DRAFT_26075 [Dioszegia hungarica]|uniref:Uncharacterized protein n=1 Tax=Dioszegia hungarica TaxID=4972 RepID=A0AA38H8E4_9TREE|nr:uncharacterized protein MKK02DRAFT_26075 [Dioszegia hungarica]KAI9635763.1 hypothetical protein MKK02DRAFT_26075 [Dioszegia hungarica]